MKKDLPAIDLYETTDPQTGAVLFAERPADGSALAVTRPSDLTIDNGTITRLTATSEQNGDEPAVSRLPTERMAASSWDDIAKELRNNESGRGNDVQLAPGGQLVVVSDKRSAQPLSRLPQERMAALTRGPSPADVQELRHLDPNNVEQWAPVSTDLLSGWSFRMRPPIAYQDDFIFLAFRSPSDGNAFRISVVQPNADKLFGHAPHMIRAQVGDQKIPVICGPGGRAARSLADVRTHAAKWMAYTSARMAGLNPGFSL